MTADMASPRFLPAPHARPAAQRFCDRYGLPRPRWALRERMARRDSFAASRGRTARFTPEEVRELRAWAPWWGVAEPWVRAVRFVRRPLMRRLWRLARVDGRVFPRRRVTA